MGVGDRELVVKRRQDAKVRHNREQMAIGCDHTAHCSKRINGIWEMLKHVTQQDQVIRAECLELLTRGSEGAADNCHRRMARAQLCANTAIGLQPNKACRRLACRHCYQVRPGPATNLQDAERT
jgi:hypothetical protein